MAAASTMTTYRIDPETGERVVIAVGKPPALSLSSKLRIIDMAVPSNGDALAVKVIQQHGRQHR